MGNKLAVSGCMTFEFGIRNLQGSMTAGQFQRCLQRSPLEASLIVFSFVLVAKPAPNTSPSASPSSLAAKSPTNPKPAVSPGTTPASSPTPPIDGYSSKQADPIGLFTDRYSNILPG
jgi:hypothetical protein